eukprot:jgi/Chrzof1/4931/Cz15g05020.t1
MLWRTVSPNAARPKDRPEKLHAAAMATTGSIIWMYGGQHGRKFLRNLYSLDTETLTWQLHTPGGAAPGGRAGHTLAAAGDEAVYLFGGQGKKLYNDLFVLGPGGNEWVELRCRGKIPTPRRGHSLIWDGGDQLICFAGSTAQSTDNGLFVYSISRNEWFVPESSGAIPSPRTHHSAVMVGHSQMLVFGGCNALGVFFNDSYILDLGTYTWTKPQQLNTAPAPRYYHSCTSVAGKVVMYGGINPKQSFDSIVLFETSFQNELSAVADELARMSVGSQHSDSSLGSRGPSGSLASGPMVNDLMKLQLRDLLVKRNMEELHLSASRKAEAVEGQLKEEQAARAAVSKELMQYKLIAAEAEEAKCQLQDQLADTSSNLAKETAEGERLRSTLAEAKAMLTSKDRQLAEAKGLLDSVSGELGVLSSRYHRLQLEHKALKRRQQQQQQASSQEKQQQQERQDVATHASASCSSVDGADDDTVSSYSTADTNLVPLQPCPAATAATALPAASESASLGTQRAVSPTPYYDSSSVLDPCTDEPVPLCPHGQLTASCLVCICQRYLMSSEDTAPVAPELLAPGSGLDILRRSEAVAATTSSSSTPALPQHDVEHSLQYRELLSLSELARNRLDAENADHSARLSRFESELSVLKHQVACLQGQPAALDRCSVSELKSLETVLDRSSKAVRDLVIERSIAEYQRRASVESHQCTLCMEAPRSLVFGCGHQCCDKCGDKLTACPFCRQEISAKIRLYNM